MKVIKPPNEIMLSQGSISIFLAGSIEMGHATNWQAYVEQQLKDLEVTLLNPRRDDFDPTAKQEISNEYFFNQVMWELAALERADLIIVYFDPTTKSPITLIELGLHARSNKLLVCCPSPYWRKGNVDIVCQRYNIPQFQTLDQLLTEIRTRVSKTT